MYPHISNGCSWFLICCTFLLLKTGAKHMGCCFLWKIPSASKGIFSHMPNGVHHLWPFFVLYFSVAQKVAKPLHYVFMELHWCRRQIFTYPPMLFPVFLLFFVISLVNKRNAKTNAMLTFWRTPSVTHFVFLIVLIVSCL